jgi:pilus assembly protein FimV
MASSRASAARRLPSSASRTVRRIWMRLGLADASGTTTTLRGRGRGAAAGAAAAGEAAAAAAAPAAAARARDEAVGTIRREATCATPLEPGAPLRATAAAAAPAGLPAEGGDLPADGGEPPPPLPLARRGAADAGAGGEVGVAEEASSARAPFWAESFLEDEVVEAAAIAARAAAALEAAARCAAVVRASCLRAWGSG